MKFGDMQSNYQLPYYELHVLNNAPGWAYANGGQGAGALATFQMPWTGSVHANLVMNWGWHGFQHVWNWFTAGTQTPDFAPQSASLNAWYYSLYSHHVYGIWYTVAAGTSFTVSVYTVVGGGGPQVDLDSFSLDIMAHRTS